MARPTHFEINTVDAKKTKKFYEKVFGWRFQKWDGPMNYWLIMTGDGTGIDGGMTLESETQAPPCNTIDVDDVDKIVDLIVQNGGQVVAPKMEVPGVGFLAYIKDPDGTIWGLMQDTTK